MTRRGRRTTRELVRAARSALGMTQLEFGSALGSSTRTAKRWENGSSHPGATLTRIIALLVPVDRELAEEIANEEAPLFEVLGIPKPVVPPASPAAPAAPVPAAPASRATERDLADVVLCATAEQSDLPPRALRPLLHAAFARARALGLTVEQLDEAFAPSADAGARAPRRELRLRVHVPEPPAESIELEPAPARSGRARVR
ncbi:MAG: helix-turn-helix domain-containing protein [Polyangiaceae bacterium]